MPHGWQGNYTQLNTSQCTCLFSTNVELMTSSGSHLEATFTASSPPSDLRKQDRQTDRQARRERRARGGYSQAFFSFCEYLKLLQYFPAQCWQEKPNTQKPRGREPRGSHSLDVSQQAATAQGIA